MLLLLPLFFNPRFNWQRIIRISKFEQILLQGSQNYNVVFGYNELGSELGNLELMAQFYCLDVLGIDVWNCCPILRRGPRGAT
jgi:hypothetical protein